MYITEVCSGVKKKIIISKIESKDFKVLAKKRYSFHWESIKDVATI
jgi:hypothetical protein